VRYSPSGGVDTTFGRQGWTKSDLGGAETVADLAPAPDGRPVLVATQQSSGSSRVVVARYPVTPDTLSVDAWGWNAVGQLGDGTAATRSVARPSALPASAPGGVMALVGGGYHSLALWVSGSVWAWGWNGYGQLGDGTTTERDRPVEVPGLHDVSAVSAGLLHSLAVSGGRVYAWGWNGYGQLGDGTTATRLRPVQVPGLSDIVAVSAGAYHSLALRIDGTVWAWGWNGLGQLGDGTTVNRLAPIQVAGVFRASAVSAGAFHSLAVASEDQAHDAGSVLAWGYNGMGQASVDATAWAPLPSIVYGMGRPVQIAAGGYHNLMLTDDGKVLAWGWNGYGQLGDASTVQKSYPVVLPGVSDASAIATGLVHSVAVGRDGLVRTWGWNGVGQLGDGTTTDRHAPVVVAGVAGASAVGAGADHSAAGLRSGR
jgi:alpha-tubulin suppressor-like RCC1 family protein